MYCEYYHARVNVRKTWFIGGVFRNEDNITFERTLPDTNEVLEFFVPAGQEEEFLFLMEYLKNNNYVYSYEKLQNRFLK